MKKRIVFIVLLVVLGSVMPCFAKVVSVKGAYENFYIERFFDNKQFSFTSKDLSEESKNAYSNVDSRNVKTIIGYWRKEYWFANEMYGVSLIKSTAGITMVGCTYCTPGGYSEKLFEQTYYDYNTAKSKFDQLCNTCYNKMFK